MTITADLAAILATVSYRTFWDHIAVQAFQAGREVNVVVTPSRTVAHLCYGPTCPNGGEFGRWYGTPAATLTEALAALA